jgi:hypothetical protein
VISPSATIKSTILSDTFNACFARANPRKQNLATKFAPACSQAESHAAICNHFERAISTLQTCDVVREVLLEDLIRIEKSSDEGRFSFPRQTQTREQMEADA